MIHANANIQNIVSHNHGYKIVQSILLVRCKINKWFYNDFQDLILRLMVFMMMIHDLSHWFGTFLGENMWWIKNEIYTIDSSSYTSIFDLDHVS